MNCGRADASTSTEDVKGRPLCLFYFTHPFGVLSPEPPTITTAPPNIARTFVNMEPVPPFWTSSSSPYYDTTSTRPSYDLGNATVHRNPINLVRNYEVDFRRDTISSSLFSSDLWFSSSASSRNCERRVIPYNKILPPLQLPTRDLTVGLDSSDDFWPKKCLNREKFSLPPIQMQLSSVSDVLDDKVSVCESDSVKKYRRVFGVQKHKRKNRLSSVRRMLTCLMRRNTKGGRTRHASPALREALRLLRDAWPEPRSLKERCKATSEEESCGTSEKNVRNMWGNDVPARAAASPGLLRRRYSVPETIMRKYRLAQQRSEGESDETGRWSASGAAAGTRNSCAWCGAKSGARREREHMRKSALLRLWGRAGASPARTCPCVPCPPCGTRSLDASHSELRTSPRRLRLDSRDRHSDCSSSGSPARVASSCTDPIPDIAREASPRRITETRIVRTPIDSPILQVETIDRSLTSSSDIFTTSMPTMKENPFKISEPYTQISKSEYIDGRVSERSISAENEESNIVPYTKPLTLETPSYDVLEIIVSETVDVRPTLNPSLKNRSPEKILPATNTQPLKNHLTTNKKSHMDLDEYVSNILVESLNSLTDQLESMNASIGSDRKLNIVEKEIKVKLQNTGVNTIVHLSPTSNNQIIFGNEELYESDGRRDNCNNPHEAASINIAEDVLSVETNNNFTSAESLRNNEAELSHDKVKSDKFLNISNETVNKAVLQQIQKLFKEELQNIEPDMNSPDGPLPGISHIEISNVDVFIDNNGGSYPNTDTIEMQTNRNSGIEVLGGVGAGNYYQEVEDNAIVPRFSAFPHTESMEVNTSSSEDAELLGSECASLVDSLDDPNSPRSILLRRSYNTNKRSELVRSAIDVLDLLPEDATQGPNSPKEKSESFFIRIKDNDCDCEKENIVVADHMPETIKQRLYRRHRKREMRMECARRSKVKQLKRDLESQNRKEIYKTKREVERECMVIINSVIDDVIAKIAQDEYKCMRISQKSNKLVAAKSDENLIKKQMWKKDHENNNNNRNARKLTKNNISHSCSENLDKDHRKSERIIRGKLSLQTHPPLSPDDCGPKRIYQKSEIRDGNKCIEILEILEYVNSSQNSDTTTSDENHNLSSRNRKSRIPVPVNEKVQKTSKVSTQRNHKNNGSSRRTPPILSRDRNGKSHLLANMLFDVLSEETSAHEIPIRRASVPCESRARSNSLRFKNVFDIIPEERSSLSLESTGDDSYNRRASAPSLSEFPSTEEEIRPAESNKYRDLRYSDTKNAGTSPMPDLYRAQVVHVGAMTSPIRKSAGTSPIRITSGESRIHSEQMNKHPQPKLAKRVQKHDEGSARQKSVSSQYEPTRRLRGGHSENDAIPSIFNLKRGKKNDKESPESTSISERRSSEGVSVGDRSKNRSRNLLGIPRKEKKSDERKQKVEGGREGEGEEWSSSESSGSLLCSLAPAWLTARRRRRRAAPSGEWAVTVAGSCPAALPNDVEMRLRFPDPRRRNSTSSEQTPRPPPPPPVCHRAVDCSAQCSQGGRTRRVIDDASRLTLTVKKEASDSSIVASKSVKKSSDLLPDLHTYRASRSKTRSSVKTRRGYSLHCWLPEDEPMPIRARNGLAVEGNAIVPHHKPRAPSMSERDLTRGLSTRHHLPMHFRNIF